MPEVYCSAIPLLPISVSRDFGEGMSQRSVPDRLLVLSNEVHKVFLDGMQPPEVSLAALRLGTVGRSSPGLDWRNRLWQGPDGTNWAQHPRGRQSNGSLGYFVTHIHQLKPIPLVMIEAGAFIGFWAPLSRRQLERRG